MEAHETSSEIALLPRSQGDQESTPIFHPSPYKGYSIPSWFSLQIFPGLLLTTTLSGLLLFTACTNTTFTGTSYNFVTSNRATIQIVIQLISHALGLLHVLVITTAFNVFTRKWHAKQAVSLDCLKWWNSMCNLRLDASLPRHFIMPLVFFIAFSFLPAAFWAGATTPVITTKAQTRNLRIPQYGPDPNAQFWNQSAVVVNTNITRTALGSFSYNPGLNVIGSILDKASSATAPNSSFQTHQKLDNSGFAFHGRSYGVGASVGLETFADIDAQHYTFYEAGYMSNMTCWYNKTMDFRVALIHSSGTDLPNLYKACGQISNGAVECIRGFPGYGDDSQIVVMLGNPHNGHNQWGIATGKNATRYTALNQTSCEVVFYPRTFVVAVDTVEKIINVTSTGNVADDIDPSSTGSGPPNGQVSLNVVQQMGFIVQTMSSGRFTPFGNALISNVVNTNFSKINGYLPESLDDSQISLMGIESALETIVDDILMAFSSAQFVIAAQEGGIKQITTNATVAAIRIGEPSYIYIITTINALLLLYIALEAIRNNVWRTLSVFDYRDLKSVVIGSSLGGTGIAVEVLKRKDERSEKWNADPEDRVAGRTMVRLNGTEGVLITLGDHAK